MQWVNNCISKNCGNLENVPFCVKKEPNGENLVTNIFSGYTRGVRKSLFHCSAPREHKLWPFSSRIHDQSFFME